MHAARPCHHPDDGILEPGLMRSSDSHSSPAPPHGRKLQECRGEAREVMMRALGAPAEGAGMDCVLAAQHARSFLAHPIRAPFLNGPNARVDSLLAPSTAQICLTKLHARHLRQHGNRLASPTDLAEPAGLGDFPFMHAQVLTAVVLLLLSEDAREALAAAVCDAERRCRSVGGRSGSRWGRRQLEAPWRRHFLE